MNNNEKTTENTMEILPLRFNVEFEVAHGKTKLTPEKEAELIFMQDYLCLSAILWTMGKLNYIYKDDGLLTEMRTLIEHNEYLCLIGAALLEDMSSRMQRQYFFKGGKTDEK